MTEEQKVELLPENPEKPVEIKMEVRDLSVEDSQEFVNFEILAAAIAQQAYDMSAKSLARVIKATTMAPFKDLPVTNNQDEKRLTAMLIKAADLKMLLIGKMLNEFEEKGLMDKEMALASMASEANKTVSESLNKGESND